MMEKMSKNMEVTIVMNKNRAQRNFTHLIRCQTMKVKPYIILNMSRKHVNYEEDKNKVPMNKLYNNPKYEYL